MAGLDRLKLRAHDAEDLRAMATLLQDALVPLSDIAYLKAEKRFVLVANRFRWEAAGTEVPPASPEDEAAEPDLDARFEDFDGDREPAYERIHCGLCFDRVKGVRVRGLDMKDRRQIVNLLTIASGRKTVTLVFSGGGEIRLDVSGIRCHMEDLGEAWPTRWRPAHAGDETRETNETNEA